MELCAMETFLANSTPMPTLKHHCLLSGSLQNGQLVYQGMKSSFLMFLICLEVER